MARFEEQQNLRGVDLDLGIDEAHFRLADRLQQFASQMGQTGRNISRNIGRTTKMAGDIQEKKAAEDFKKEGFPIERDENDNIIPPKGGGISTYAKTRNRLQMDAYKASLAKDTEADIRALEVKHQGDLPAYNDAVETYKASMVGEIDPAVSAEWLVLADDFTHASRLRVQDRQIKADINEAQTDLKLAHSAARERLSQAIANGEPQEIIDDSFIGVVEAENALYDTLSVEEKAVFDISRANFAKSVTNEMFMADVMSVYREEGYDAAIARHEQLGKKVPQDYEEKEYYGMLQDIKSRLNSMESGKRSAGVAKNYQLGIELKNLEDMIEVEPAFVNEVKMNELGARVYQSQDPRLISRYELAKETRKYMTYPESQLDEMIPEIRGENAGTFRKRLIAARQNRKKAFYDDGITTYSNLHPDEEIPAMDDILGRSRYLSKVSSFSGIPVEQLKYFTKADAAGLSQIAEEGTEAEVQSVMSLIYDIPDEFTPTAAGQLIENGAGWMVQAAYATPQAQRLVMKGRRLTTGETPAFEPLKIAKAEQDDFTTKIEDYFGDTLDDAPQNINAIVDAAKHAYIAQHGSNTYGWGNMKETLKMFGAVETVNGFKTILPPGVEKGEFQRFVTNIKMDDLEIYDTPIPKDRVLKAIKDGRLKNVGNDTYQVIYSNGAYVPDINGDPLEIIYNPDISARATTQYQRRQRR